MLASVRWRWVQASACTISREQPASTKRSAITSGVYTMRCASNGIVQCGAGGLDHVGTERQVGDELAVHHVPLDAVGAGRLERRDLVAEPREVGREHRRDDLDRARHAGDATGRASRPGAPTARRRRPTRRCARRPSGASSRRPSCSGYGPSRSSAWPRSDAGTATPRLTSKYHCSGSSGMPRGFHTADRPKPRG